MQTIAKILIFNSDNQVLILKRSDSHPYFPLHWDFPGGVVENGEDSAEGAVRELWEEAGIRLGVEKVKKVYEKQLAGNKIHLIYLGNINKTNIDVELSWEHSDFKWLTPKQLVELEIPENVDNYYLTVLRYVKSVLNLS